MKISLKAGIIALVFVLSLVAELFMFNKPDFAGSNFNWVVALTAVNALTMWLVNVFVLPWVVWGWHKLFPQKPTDVTK